MKKYGIPISIGISYTKTLSKVAERVRKLLQGVAKLEFWEVASLRKC